MTNSIKTTYVILPSLHLSLPLSLSLSLSFSVSLSLVGHGGGEMIFEVHVKNRDELLVAFFRQPSHDGHLTQKRTPIAKVIWPRPHDTPTMALNTASPYMLLLLVSMAKRQSRVSWRNFTISPPSMVTTSVRMEGSSWSFFVRHFSRCSISTG